MDCARFGFLDIWRLTADRCASGPNSHNAWTKQEEQVTIAYETKFRLLFVLRSRWKLTEEILGHHVYHCLQIRCGGISRI